MTQPDDQRLLLDTHVFLWLLLGSPELGRSDSLTSIELAAERDALYLSAASILEIATMERHGVLRLSMPTERWVRLALETPGLREVPVDREISLAAATLPDPFEGDLADRCIVATARSLNCLLLTADPVLHAYAAQGYVRAAAVERQQQKGSKPKQSSKPE